MSETHEALGRDLVAAAVLRGSFLLRSGARSSYYIDKYLFTTRPDLLGRLADELLLRLPTETQRVAGPVLGAIPLVTALSLKTQLPMLIVRVEKAKEYGTAKQIEGLFLAGEKVVLIEDVVTTGGAALGAAAWCMMLGVERPGSSAASSEPTSSAATKPTCLARVRVMAPSESCAAPR